MQLFRIVYSKLFAFYDDVTALLLIFTSQLT